MRAFYLLVFKNKVCILSRKEKERIKGAPRLISTSYKDSNILRDPSTPRLRLYAQGDI